MTLQSPRIYTYKITFEEVPYYYYGVHKEKSFNEEYFGSPHTNKWCWELYTPKKQILEFFEYSDDGWKEANSIEKRIIKQFLNDDLCLNESVGGYISLKMRTKIGKELYKLKKGVHSLSKEERIENASKAGKIGGKISYEKGVGVFSLTLEQKREISKKTYSKGKGIASISSERRSEISKESGKLGGAISGKNHKKNKTGFFAMTPEEKSEVSKKAGKITKERGVGIFAVPYEEMRERNLKNALQKWKCLETGFIANAGNLTKYQKARGIDTSKRIRIE